MCEVAGGGKEWVCTVRTAMRGFRLQELCYDFVADYPPPQSPPSRKPLFLPQLRWLAVPSCVAVSALEPFNNGDLQVPEHLVCKTGYEPIHTSSQP
ncbi:hypothetical protein M422DRAFT_265524 [Sphaerobolus stellatus SS14]|uniref:Uncharacterized protein n=1 Tax=Sphaerobolus stellatus (strain SS14) TaxID=990650 RepID=A0A0C9V5D9_SPHS4|nr:hypothetical protein M422DRAFT_265524 [Sphaerobolus stellatus SS14]